MKERAEQIAAVYFRKCKHGNMCFAPPGNCTPTPLDAAIPVYRKLLAELLVKFAEEESAV